jgi:hypothetical protein
VPPWTATVVGLESSARLPPFAGSCVRRCEPTDSGNGQAVRIPDEFRFNTDRVGARRQGEAVVLEPLKPATWPAGFFDAI